jgi:hypothetical protein
LANSYDADLDWWFGCGDSFLGEKRNLSSTISALERGGANIGVFEEPWSDLKLSKWHVDMDRERRIRARFVTLPRKTQKVLIAYYSKEQNRIPQLEAKYELLSGIMLHLAESWDALNWMKPKEIRALEADARLKVKEAHAAWRAKKPRKASNVLEDFEIPLPLSA